MRVGNMSTAGASTSNRNRSAEWRRKQNKHVGTHKKNTHKKHKTMDALTSLADARRPAGAATTKHPVNRQGLGPCADGGEHAEAQKLLVIVCHWLLARVVCCGCGCPQGWSAAAVAALKSGWLLLGIGCLWGRSAADVAVRKDGLRQRWLPSKVAGCCWALAACEGGLLRIWLCVRIGMGAGEEKEEGLPHRTDYTQFSPHRIDHNTQLHLAHKPSGASLSSYHPQRTPRHTPTLIVEELVFVKRYKLFPP